MDVNQIMKHYQNGLKRYNQAQKQVNKYRNMAVRELGQKLIDHFPIKDNKGHDKTVYTIQDFLSHYNVTSKDDNSNNAPSSDSDSQSNNNNQKANLLGGDALKNNKIN